MNDPLDQLLHRADARFSHAGAAGDLAQRVPKIVRKRRAARGGAIGALAVAAVVTAMFWPAKKPMETGAPSIARLQEEAREYRQAAEIHLAAAERMLASESAATRARKFIPDPQRQIREERELAATTLLHQADRYLHELKRPEAASAEYRRIIELFPASAPADSARQRLKQMNL